MPSPMVNDFGGWFGPASRLQDANNTKNMLEAVAQNSCNPKLMLNNVNSNLVMTGLSTTTLVQQ